METIESKRNETLTYEDFETYLPEYEFDEKQIEFFKDTFELITSNRNTNKVTCFPPRCGIGKSTFIKAFMHTCIGNEYFNGRYEPTGLIVITDSIKRLEGCPIVRKTKKWQKKFGVKYLTIGVLTISIMSLIKT